MITLFLTLIALFSSAVLASPIQRRAISPDLLAAFNLYEQYAAAAYCPSNNDSPNTKIICTSDNCPLVEAANTDSIIEFQNTAGTDTTGFLTTDTTNNLLVLSFRGSISIRNWLADLDFPLIPIGLCPGCLGESGFWASWVETRDMITAAIKSALAANPTFKIVVTGHSLGAAVGTFAATQLRNEGLVVDLCNFGSPRVGDPTTAAYITNQSPSLGNNYRITHLNDIVPRFPPESFGFLHVAPEYYITSATGAPVTPADIDVCEGLGNSDCNSSWLFTDIAAHGWYFGSISACYFGGPIEFDTPPKL